MTLMHVTIALPQASVRPWQRFLELGAGSNFKSCCCDLRHTALEQLFVSIVSNPVTKVRLCWWPSMTLMQVTIVLPQASVRL